MHPLDRLLRVILPLGLLAVVGMVLLVGWTTQPNRYAEGYAPAQPMPFSHKVHAGDNQIPCLYCHAGAEQSRIAGIPSLDLCMNCHQVTRTSTDSIIELTELYQTGQPIFWERVHNLPDHVFFDHRPHVNSGIACQVCHGEVEKMEVLAQGMSLRMGNCLDCHRNAHAYIGKPEYQKDIKPDLTGSDSCYACHR